MSSRSDMWIVLLCLFSIIVAHPHLDQDLRKHFYGATSDEKVIQNEEDFDTRHKRLVEDVFTVNGLNPDLAKRFYVDEKACQCEDVTTEVVATTQKPKKKKPIPTCCSTTAEELTTSFAATIISTSTVGSTSMLPTTFTSTKAPITTTALVNSSISETESHPLTPTTISTSSSSLVIAANTTSSYTATDEPLTFHFEKSRPALLPGRPLVQFLSAFPIVHNITSASLDSSGNSSAASGRYLRPSSNLRPDCTDVESCAQHHEALKRILRKLNRLVMRTERRLKISTLTDDEDISDQSQDGVSRQRPVAPAATSCDRPRNVREDSSPRKCRSPEKDRRCVRFMRSLVWEVKRSLRIRRRELPLCEEEDSDED
ncbi:mucin-3B-like [Armigeres subalbatus]|uniref:mucin-3B-like n=1 Tax=Armigeres subalbatus TaxID=124917 RepID=UPI002ED68BED